MKVGHGTKKVENHCREKDLVLRPTSESFHGPVRVLKVNIKVELCIVSAAASRSKD